MIDRRSKSDSGSDTVTYQSGWIGGGNSQTSICLHGRDELQVDFPEKKLVLISTSEQSRRDWAGRTDYNYLCVFKIVEK